MRFRRSTWCQCTIRSEQAPAPSSPSFCLSRLDHSSEPARRRSKKNAGWRKQLRCHGRRLPFALQRCVRNGFALVRRSSATFRSEQHIHAGCSTAPRFSQALETGGKEQLPIADGAPSQRRGEFKAGQISLTMVDLLVSCSPIFQSLCPTNRLCSPPSGSCVCTCISPQSKIHQSAPSLQAQVPSLARCAFAASCRTTTLCSFLVSYASHIPQLPPGVWWSDA